MTNFSLRQDRNEPQLNDYQVMMEKLLIFDCDGVLVDSESIVNRIYAEIISSSGYPTTMEECIRKFTGLHTKAVHQILQESGTEIADMRSSMFLNTFETELKALLQPVLEIVDGMRVSRCIATCMPKERVVHALAITEQLHFFNESSIFTQLMQGGPIDLFLYAANQMGFCPENCIVIEDSASGIDAALSAGMSVVGFLGGSHADYDWYQEKIYSYNVPVAKNSHELLQILKSLLTTKTLHFKKNGTNELIQKY